MSEGVREASAQPEAARAGGLKTVLVCLLILAASLAVAWLIFATEPTAERGGASKQTAMLVEVTEAQKGTYQPTITAMGTVRPAREIVLRPRVSGEIVDRASEFTPGGIVQKGETLLRIERADYRIQLAQRQSQLRQAQADLKLEMGRQNVAQQEFQLLGEDLGSGANKALVLREPQLDVARAEVDSAQAAVRQARLDLQRTSLEAPFDARVLTREVNVGSQVNVGDQLARLVGLDTYWVETTVPMDKLRWLKFPRGPDGEGARVQVSDATAWPEGVHREGRLHKLVGELESNSRMARVLVAVDDPFARSERGPERPALMLGAFVESRIRGRALEDVVKLNRDYLRKDDTVWVMKDGKLAIRDARIAFAGDRYAYLRSGVNDGERVVTSQLATVAEGAALRLRETPADDTRNEQRALDGESADTSG